MGAAKVGKRYRGKGARNYEKKRTGKNKWILENQGVDELFPFGCTNVLDVPIGTGRFYPSYERRGLQITGVDTSPDMLTEANKKGPMTLIQGDIRNMPFQDKQFDVAVCVRLFAWFEPSEVQAALREMARVARILIVNIRTNAHDPFCKNNSLWNHYRSDFFYWVQKINYKVTRVFNVGNNGNDIYRLEER